jgi:tetratricopeptide (TPR) repeat protein
VPFVGRQTQLGALVSAVGAAEYGESVLALIAGEPGIGKTRLASEVAAAVATAGSVRVLWGMCLEDEGAPAYWPWLQLLRPLVADREADGPGAATMQHGGEVHRLLAQVPSPDVSPDARFRLFDTVADVFGDQVHSSPLVLVLDDLHWADEGSIRLLQFLARDPRMHRLAIIGTYRDTDLDPDHPLARCLGDLVRHGLHIALGGLAKADVVDLIGALNADGRDLAGLVPLLHRQSGGNPLYLRELIRLLDTEGSPGDLDLGLGAPTGLRAVVARRLRGLSQRTQEVLAAAAVVGTDVELGTLAPVTGLSNDELLAAVNEAAAARLVIGTGAGFSFVHAVVRGVLYDGLSLSRRAGLHRNIAEVIESRYGDTRLPELAHHVLAGSVGAGDDRAVGYAKAAAERSFGLLAYEEAASWYGRALDVLRANHPDDAMEGDLLLGCGQARAAAGDLPGARAAYEQAAVIARRAGDAEQLARAALGMGAGFGGFEVRLLDPVQIELLEEALDALDARPTRLRAWVLARLSVALSFVEAEDRRRALAEQAVAMAREVADPSALGYALAGHCDVDAGPDGCEVRLAESAEVVRLGRQTDDRQLEALGRRLRLVALLEVGDLAAADIELERFARVAERLRQPLYRWYVPLWRGMRALMRGELDEAARYCAQAEEIGTMAHSDNAVVLTFTQWWVLQRYAGRFAEAGAAMAELLGAGLSGPPVTAGPRAIAALQTGDHDTARVLLQQWLAAGRHLRIRDSEWLPESAQLAQAAVGLGARELAQVLYGQLKPYAHRFCIEGIGAACTGSVAWYLALLARFLGDSGEAEAYEALARTAHGRVGLVGEPPPLARVDGSPAVAPAAARADTALTAKTASLLREGVTWAVTYAGKTRRLRDSKGLGDLAVLLARPGQEVHCLELVGGAEVGAEAGPVLDQQARRAYERRIRDLQEDIDEARDLNDPIRAERAEAELDALVQQLAEAFGLSGRSRATGSAAERARSAVSWRIRAAIRHAAQLHPEFARHVQNAVRTGAWCSYRPESAVAWQIDAGQGRRA